MIDRLEDVVTSLLLLMEEETQYLRQCPFGGGLPELAATKLRLVGQLEQIAALVARHDGGWTATLDQAAQEDLAALFHALEQVSVANAAALKRQIDLSTELIGAIATEAKRQAGRATAVYGAEGTLARFDPAMPIAVDSQY